MPSENQTTEQDKTMHSTNITKHPKTEIARIIKKEPLIVFIAFFNVMGLMMDTHITHKDFHATN